MRNVVFVVGCAGLLAATPLDAQDSVRLEGVLLKVIEAVNVPAETAGALQSIAVREGDEVQAGQVLGTVRDVESRLRLQEAEHEYEAAQLQQANDVNIRFARKTLEVAQTELLRAQNANLRMPNTVSGTELDRLNLVVEKSRLEIEQAEFQHQVADVNLLLKRTVVQQRQAELQRYRLVAPVDGMVAAIHRRPGEWVNLSDAVLRIVNIQRLRTEDFVTPEVAARGLVGRPAVFEIDSNLVVDDQPRTYRGQVVFVSPEANPVNSEIRFWAEFENTDLRLRPGLKGSLVVELD